MPGEIERDHAEILRHALIVHQAAELPAVGAGGVQAQERDPLPGLLDVEPVRAAEQVEAEIASDDRLNCAGITPPISSS